MTQLASFYRFTAIADPAELAARLEDWCRAEQIKGSVLIASEGINGALVGEVAALTHVLARLRDCRQLSDLSATLTAVAQGVRPFRRLRVRVRDEIVTFGQPRASNAIGGTAVDASTWHRLLDDPQVRIVDVRNAYETALGGFPGAIDPHTENFAQFRQFVADALAGDPHRPIALYCTGGIRCTKASAWMHGQGFTQVYELVGGVLGYLQTVAPEENRWHGNCFVFDDRVTVNKHLQPGGERLCRDCGAPWLPTAEHDNLRQCAACRAAA